MKNIITQLLFILVSSLLFTTALQAQAITFTVNSTLDAVDATPGDGLCDDGSGNCTLRAAITEANANAGFHDIIQFFIGGPGYGVRTISPGSQLPSLTDNSGVTIDGTTQPLAILGLNPPATAKLIIEIKGNNAGVPPVHGFLILSDSNDIRGLIINEFSGDGIRIEGTPGSTDHNLVYANFIGTDATGTLDLGNATGSTISPWWAGVSIIVPPCDTLPVFARNNTVRRNLISGNGAVPVSINRGEGVSITNCPPGDNGFNLVEYNYIGTDITGQVALGNDSDGVTIAESAHDNTIDNNLISGNGYSGVGINGLNDPVRLTINNTVSNNIIGLDINAAAPIPNGFQGVSIGMFGPITWGHAPNNQVVNNTIAHNNQNGVLIAEFNPPALNCDQNLISQNSIFANGQLGIDLVSVMGMTGVVTPNDSATDPDNGPNQECNFPVINSAAIVSGTTTITGTVRFLSKVEVFLAAPDPSGNGEGITWLGSTTPTPAGNWTLVTTTPVSANNVLTATATDPSNNTSEFSVNFTNITTGLETPLADFKFNVFPNPAKSTVTAIIDQLPSGKHQLKVISLSGKVLKIVPLAPNTPSSTLEIDLSGYPGGLYWIEVGNENVRVAKKIIKLN